MVQRLLYAEEGKLKISPHFSRWGAAFHLGPFIEWEEWNVNHYDFTIGLEIGPLIFSLRITLWDFFEAAREKALPVLMGRGMTEDEAWEFIDGIRKGIIDRKEGKVRLWTEVKKELGLQ